MQRVLAVIAASAVIAGTGCDLDWFCAEADSYCAGNEIDLYREWAQAVCYDSTDRRPSRRYACGIIALRPDRDGRIAGYEGTEGVFRQYGDNVVGSHFPEPGTPTQPVEAGYMANAWMRVRHPDYDILRAILNDIGERVQIVLRGNELLVPKAALARG